MLGKTENITAVSIHAYGYCQDRYLTTLDSCEVTNITGQHFHTIDRQQQERECHQFCQTALFPLSLEPPLSALLLIREAAFRGLLCIFQLKAEKPPQ